MHRRMVLGWTVVLVVLVVVTPAFATTLYLPMIGGAPTTASALPTGVLPTAMPTTVATPVPVSPVPTTLPTAMPPDGSYPLPLLVITTTSTFTTRVGNPAIMGEVLNQGTTPAFQVWISARGYDATQTVVATTYDTTLLNAVHGGDRVPFVIVFRGITTPFDHIALTLESAADTARPGYTEAPVTIASHTVVTTTVDQQPLVGVTGVVRNDGERDIEARVAVTFYDAHGGVVAVSGDDSMPTTLTPHTTSTFTLQAEQPCTWTHYRLQAQGVP